MYHVPLQKAVNYFLPTYVFSKLLNGPAPVKSFDGYFKVLSEIIKCYVINKILFLLSLYL